MTVNSLEFLLFFAVFFAVYSAIPCLGRKCGARAGIYADADEVRRKLQNLWLLAGNIVFYAFAEPRMLPLLGGVIGLYWLFGLAAGRFGGSNERVAGLFSAAGVVSGIGILLYFKYLDFFIESFADLLSLFGFRPGMRALGIVLPVGVSFFVFKLMSYVIDIRRGVIAPTRDFIAFAAYVSFFPTMLSGPIDRPKAFLPQLATLRRFSLPMASDGCRQILWGIVKKMLLADNLAVLTDACWSDMASQSTVSVLIAVLVYPVQMYMDFSGYSDMAIGVGKILGFRVARNFSYPFFARNIAEYWRGWHISLTSWLTDYVFMPLNVRFRDWGTHGSVLAIIITFVLIGMWHGASWTFLLFGLYHGLLYVPLMYSGAFFRKSKLKEGRFGLPSASDAAKMASTYLLVALGLIIFRAPSLAGVADCFTAIFTGIGRPPLTFGLTGRELVISGAALLLSFGAVAWEWYGRKKEYVFAAPSWRIFRPRAMRIAFYAAVFIVVMMFATNSNEFIYFSF